MNVELDEDQIREIVWIMEHKVSVGVMALPQFAKIRAAKETLRKALEFPPNIGEMADKDVRRARIDAKLMGIGFLIILNDGTIKYMPADAVSIDTAKVEWL